MISHKTVAIAAALVSLGIAGTASADHGGWSFGLRVGGPVYYRPYYAPYYYHYYPYRTVYVAPPPVYVEPAPIVVQSPPATQPVYQTPTLQPVPASATVQVVSQAEIDGHLQMLRDADERVRAEHVLQLGRLKAVRAVDPLAATLAGDRSSTVREAAARALALIGSPNALPALKQAALADSDRDVRHSAQFAVDVIQSAK